FVYKQSENVDGFGNLIVSYNLHDNNSEIEVGIKLAHLKKFFDSFSYDIITKMGIHEMEFDDGTSFSLGVYNFTKEMEDEDPYYNVIFKIRFKQGDRYLFNYSLSIDEEHREKVIE